MALHLPDHDAEERRLSSLSDIQANARSFLQSFPTPSSRYSHQSLPEHDDREHRRRSSAFAGFREFLHHGRSGSGNIRSSSISHLPLTHQEATEHDEHDAHDIEDDDEELGEEHRDIMFSPLTPPAEWHMTPPIEPEPAVIHIRHPSGPPPPFEHSDTSSSRDLEAQTEQPSSSNRRRRKRRRGRGGAWIKRSGTARRDTCVPDTIRARTIATVTTGAVLVILLAVYLSIALTIHGLDKEFHVLLGICIGFTTLFFSRNLYRMGMLMMALPNSSTTSSTHRRRPSDRSHRSRRSRSVSGRPQRIPSVAGPDGFLPEELIQVHLASDEEIMASHADGSVETCRLESLKAPPPAYGLWRSSVKANPAFLHWVRADSVRSVNGSASCSTASLVPNASPNPSSSTASQQPATIGLLSRSQVLASGSGSGSGPEMMERSQLSRLSRISEGAGPRPPSYMTDDGIDDLLGPQRGRGPMVVLPEPQAEGEVHPAHRNCTTVIE